jgi:hypothetical protein
VPEIVGGAKEGLGRAKLPYLKHTIAEICAVELHAAYDNKLLRVFVW